MVGIGPGSYEQMTIKAAHVLESCETIVGYTVYVELMKKHFGNKEFLTTPMKKEVDRCILAFEEAKKGKTVAMICSGDAGVYGMAGLMIDIGATRYPEFEVEIVSGVTAALGGGSLLGAPFIHDFAVISLSDLLTPWETIQSRLIHASMADLVICLYNPSSKKRHDYLEKACDLIMEHQPETLICGIVKNIARDGETIEILTLKELRDKKVDMFTTVYIGNSNTKRVGNRMVTPRGYEYER